MANRIKKKEDTKSSYQDNVALIMGAFTLIVLCVLPLVFHDFYFDILETKYQFYSVVAIAALVIMGGYGLASGKMLEWFSKFNFQTWRKSMSVGDWAMVVFWLTNVISWILCKDWRWEAFWGTSGRYNGVFLMTIYMMTYFLVTRFYRLKQWYLDAFLAVGVFVCVFGITDYFQMDILGFKVNMMDTQKSIYTSTFGNINTYTIYVAALLAISMILFTQEKNQKRMFWYYGNMILTFFTVILCINGINKAYAASVLGIDSAFNLIAGTKFLPVLVVLLWVIAVVLIFMNRKPQALMNRTTDDSMNKIAVYIWIGVIAVVCLAVLFVLYDANLGGHADKYGALSSYAVFNDEWGTQRGYVWKRAMEIYTKKLNLLQKIFGYGPDTFALIMQYYYPGEMQNGHMVIFDSAHNEYLHYLVTTGFVGMASYLVFMVSSIVAMAKKIKEQPIVAAVMLAVTAYAIQAVVNINLPIAMPIILQLLAMGVGRKKNAGNTEEKAEA